ncbi:hypothetical protein N7520_006279 [Penicillium odoratum]|uniref:uncharacterized protein n=1 Tax=Penicillium odoratum TaxID=1167516 RepID=UPI002547315C|nr:uncharacterized protein N7520_006279 [Penicillium odoratum]KAJ5759123.1 hypothetical protein N7520_006279 [Penicillium odoratum]
MIDSDFLSVIAEVETYLGRSANDEKSSTIFVYNGNGGAESSSEQPWPVIRDEADCTCPDFQVLFDDDSDSDIIIYNDTQWVGYMTTTTKSTRTTYYKGLNMGGTTEVGN